MSGWGRTACVEELDLASLETFDAEAVAVCLLHSYRHPEHERAVAEELRRRLPQAHVVASHEIAPEFREYERASTTAADAYLGPVMSRYLQGLAALSAEAGLPEPLVMRSSGGVASVEEAAAHPAVGARLRPCRRAWSARPASPSRRGFRTRSPSTWAGRRPTSA